MLDCADQQGVQDALLYSVYSLSANRPEEEEGVVRTKQRSAGSAVRILSPNQNNHSRKEGIGARRTLALGKSPIRE